MIEAKRVLLALETANMPVSAEKMYDLVLAATENKADAERAFRDVRWAELRSGNNVA